MPLPVYLDLDRFKLVNDSLGHGAGRHAPGAGGANGCKTRWARPTRWPRTGGDEFTAVLDGVESPREAEAWVETGRGDEEAISHRGSRIVRERKCGHSDFPQDGDDTGHTPENADVAMYMAKNRGKNRFQRFSREMNSAASERLEIESHLHRALDRGRIDLHYQPQFHLASGDWPAWRR